MLQNYLKRKQSSADGAVKSFIFILALRLFKPRTSNLHTCVRQFNRKPVQPKFRAFRYNRGFPQIFSNFLKQLQAEGQILCCTDFLAHCRTKVRMFANQKFSTLVLDNKKGPTQSEKCFFFVKCSGNSQLDNFCKTKKLYRKPLQIEILCLQKRILIDFHR